MNTRPIAITWEEEGGGKLIGRLTVDGELWASVEWSQKYKRWCIEDAEGHCLTHLDNIHAAQPDKDAAVALAEAMIRDGRMPDPATAKKNAEAGVATPWAIARKAKAKQQREQRAKQPAETKRRAEEERRSELSSAKYAAEDEDRRAQPLFEALADAFDFNDPELWKSNSFAMLRPRLVLHVKAVVAKLESNLADAIHEGKTQPFSLWQTKSSGKRPRPTARRRRPRMFPRSRRSSIGRGTFYAAWRTHERPSRRGSRARPEPARGRGPPGDRALP